MLLENYELKLDNNRLHSKLKESQKVENATTEMPYSPNISVCSVPRSSNNSIQTQEMYPIVTEGNQDNQVMRNYNVKNNKKTKKRLHMQDQCGKQLSRFTALNRLFRVTVYVMSFIQNLKLKLRKEKVNLDRICIKETDSAERLWIKDAQVLLRNKGRLSETKNQSGSC